ncbi:hypothetical protein IMG5_124480 [Ichthyophthirius multifiliis]|uniref:Tetratricopeptide repeat protein 29 n=1 Tax=Ichthyophthirius multifiliis TaxID=5932 RepID=G0QVL3_ICHMU|nr:hypothetical protein IMG5_124480 [Ichthyophthirius multifiliis]EGR30736.1 hypothetical protein IMG5_124480 [Ichthyophthirius multifiliis]|eukprot:XP_004032323.1 hypothetical protein IMG5_124480 [Ichthyophthirius multifiliis]
MNKSQQSPPNHEQSQQKQLLNQSNIHQKTFSLNKNPNIVQTIAQNNQMHSTPIQPSRFGLKEKLKPISFNSIKVLEEMENQIEEASVLFNGADQNTQKKMNQYIKQIEPQQKRIKQANQFQIKPLRKKESDFQMFKEIFVLPQQSRLNQLKIAEKEQEVQEIKFLDSAEQFFHSSNTENPNNLMNNNKKDKKSVVKFNQQEVFKNQSVLINSTLKEDAKVKMGVQTQSPVKRVQEKNFKSNVSILEQTLCLDQNNEPQKQFFDQLIQVQPPDLPNATSFSPINPGNGYAPSVPLLNIFDENNKNNVKDLLIRVKAGQQAGDVQKEAHLSFYLGVVYDNQKKYNEALKSYLKYQTCANIMEDKIGIALGANRIGIDYFYINDYEKSLEYHKINIENSDQENIFAGYYNLGIVLRKYQMRQESIENFSYALQWSRDRDELESECLCLGQLGLTLQESGYLEDSLNHFTDCYELSKKLKKINFNQIVYYILLKFWDIQK